jgi:hypothetical protein
MQKNYIDEYAKQFKLFKTGNKLYTFEGKHVISIVDKYVKYKVLDEWKSCRQGEIVVSIINNIPIHTV